MGFDDFLEHGNKSHKQDYNHRDDNFHQSSHSTSKHQDYILMFLQKIKNNQQLKIVLVIVVIVLFILLVFILTLLFPFLLKMAHYLSENGIQGVVNTLWNGTKK